MAMEITGQMAALEDELKLLKGEVKSILEEIRTALLDRDNPFSPQVQANLESVKAIMAEREALITARSEMPIFQPVGRQESTAPPGAEGATIPPLTASAPPPPGAPMTVAVPAPPTPTAAAPAPLPAAATPPPAAASMPPPAPTPPPSTAEEPGTPPGPVPPLPAEAAEPPRAETTVPRQGTARSRGEAEPAPEESADNEPYAEPWTVPTIASLVAWIDESSSRLGAAHMQMILDLARFAGLLPSEAQDVLLKVIKLATGRKDSSSPSVNDILLALRQLEAILAGEEADELSLVRRRRVAGRNR